MQKWKPSSGWGPDGNTAALSLTFDNLGEAAAIEVGMWGDQPVGQHFTAPFMPRLAHMLGDVKATYFVEGSNAEIYPEALHQWVENGHEIGVHGWRHEAWDKCPPDRRVELLARSLAAFKAIGIDPTGFRPPGGVIPLECLHELRRAGFLYCSDLGSPGVAQVAGMTTICFEWPGVDAFHLEDLLAPVRVAHGYPELALGLESWRLTLKQALADTLTSRGHRTIVFHPQFIAQSEDKLAIVHELILAAKEADVWIAPLGAVAKFAAQEIGSSRTDSALRRSSVEPAKEEFKV